MLPLHRKIVREFISQHTMTTPSIVQCPVCNRRFPSATINLHVNTCLGETEDVTVIDVQPCQTTNKRKTDSSQTGDSWSFMMSGKNRAAKRLKHDSNKDSDTVVIDDSADEKCQSKTKYSNIELTTSSTGSKAGENANQHPPRELNQTSNRLRETTSHISDSSENIVHIEDLNMPLAEFMRPTSLDMYVGQEKAVGSNSMLGSLLHSKYIPSLILWGPPGCGKTTLAKIVAKKWKDRAVFKKLSAVNSGVKDVSEVVKQAKNDQRMFHKSTILFLDEIHRFNKTQQDSLLPHIEDGTITLIGATTENPAFQVNNALLSRCKVIVLEKLDCEAILKILINATERLGYHVFDTDDQIESDNKNQESGSQAVWVEKSALELLTQICDGDARIALNGLQMAVQSQMACPSQSKSVFQEKKDTFSQMSSQDKTYPIVIKSDEVKQSMQKSHIAYDKSDDRYNMLSAFHKSIRGCADSAALYWLARMLEGGESPTVVARRMVACATEDIGLADPQALVLAISAFQTVQFLGMPECEKALAECAVYLARAPKSVEVYIGYTKAKACVWDHKGPLPSVPIHLRNAPNKFLKNMGYGNGYDCKSRDQEFLPECLKGTDFFK